MDRALQWAITQILDIIAGDFYGSVTLKFEAGKLVRMESNTSQKPPADLTARQVSGTI